VRTRTFRGSVGEVLAEAGIALVGDDYSVPPAGSSITPNINVQIVRVKEEILTQQEGIPFDSVWQGDPTLEIDNQRVNQQGTPGVRQRRTRVRYENGLEVSRAVEDEWVLIEPATQINAYGTQIVVRTLDTPYGPIEYWRVIPVLATSYSASTAGTPRSSPWYGKTASGLPMRHGLVAVDPRIIPLFTQLYIPGYGIGLAADTGSAIKYRRIDLGYDDDNLVLWYSWTQVYVLTPVPDPSRIQYVLGP
jgi:3D (Asp-Asp-Asp) domain-containing protein